MKVNESEATRYRIGSLSRFGSRLGLAVALSLGVSSALADNATGTLLFQSKSGPIKIEVKHAYLFSGPDFATGDKIRRVVLSPVDLSGALAKCADLSCVSAELGEGITMDFDAGPRLGYWFVANDQRVQHSAGARFNTIELQADEPQRIAGKWVFDDTQGGGPNVDVTFDASLIKAFE